MRFTRVDTLLMMNIFGALTTFATALTLLLFKQ